MNAFNFPSDSGIEYKLFKSNIDFSRSVCVIFAPRFGSTAKNYGAELFVKNGIDVIVVYDTTDSWYQNLSLDSLLHISAYLDECGYVKRLGYGISMGGYAVIQFSKILNLQHVIAFSPQFSIEIPADTRHFHLAKNIIFIHKIDKLAISDDCVYDVIADMCYPLDRIHMDLFCSVIPKNNLIITNVKYTGHLVVRSLHERKLLKDFLVYYILNLKVNLNLIRVDRWSSATYIYNLSVELTRRKKYIVAERLLSRGLEIHANNYILSKQLGILCRHCDMIDRSLDILFGCISLMPRDCDAFIQLSISCAMANRLDEAIKYAEMAIAIDGNRSWYYTHLKKLLARVG